jgi:hypothetical protein
MDDIRVQLHPELHNKIALILYNQLDGGCCLDNPPRTSPSPPPGFFAFLEAVVHLPTLRKLATDKVDFDLYLSVPLYCTRAKNVNEVKAYEASFRVSWSAKGSAMLPDCERSEEVTYWKLYDAPQGEGYAGYWPKFCGISTSYPWDFDFVL